ncbi:integrase, catalytic region, zinc finger, CCHC-type containing protein [Tanacetum coccineum]
MDYVKPKVLAPGRYAIDVEPIPHHNRNNREVHLDYLKHLKESVETLYEIVEEAKVDRPLDRSLASACLYTKHSQELLEYKTNVHVLPSTGINSCTDASESQPRSNTKKNRISSAKSVNKKKVTEHPRTNKSSLKTTNRVDSSISFKRTKPKQVKKVWKATGKVLTSVGYQWRPTRRIFSLGEQCPLTRLTKPKVVPDKQTKNVSTSKSVITKKLSHTSQKPLTRYQRRNQQFQEVPVSLPTLPANQAIATSMQSALAYANQQIPNQHYGSNFLNSPSSSVFKCRNFMKKFIGIVRFGNDHFGAIMGYGDYVIGDSVISREAFLLFPRTLQQNGVVERWNRTLVEAARTMLIFSKVTMFLWAEAVATAFSHAPAVPVLVNSAGTPSSTTIDQDAPSPSHSPSSSALQSPSFCLCLHCRLVPSCFVFFDLEPLSLSFDFVFALLTISLDRLDIFEGRSCISEFAEIQRISLTGFPAQSVGSSNTYVLDLPCLLVLITGTSQSRQHGKSESDSYYLSD